MFAPPQNFVMVGPGGRPYPGPGGRGPRGPRMNGPQFGGVQVRLLSVPAPLLQPSLEFCQSLPTSGKTHVQSCSTATCSRTGVMSEPFRE